MDIGETLKKFAKDYGIRKTIRKDGFFRLSDNEIVFVLDGRRGIGVEFQKQKFYEEILSHYAKPLGNTINEYAIRKKEEYEKRKAEGKLYTIEIGGEKYVATAIVTRLTYRRGRLYGFMGIYAPERYDLLNERKMQEFREKYVEGGRK